jgi:ankyrin repeat protein
MSRLNQITAFALTMALVPAASYAAGSEAANAAQRQDVTALRSLVAKKTGINVAQPDGTTALHWAAHWNDTEAVKMLLKAGANPKTANRFGASPLSEAAAAANPEIVKALLQAGADPKTLTTADGETVLMTASRTGNVEIVRMLLDGGADVNAQEKYKGQTALMWAAIERHAPVVKLLLERGADWKARGFYRETRPPRLSAASSISPIPRGGFSALHFAAREGDVETVRLMLDAGVDINYGDVDNTSALVVAIMNKQFTLAKFLIERGADPNTVDASGRTPLYASVDIRNEDWSTLPNRPLEDSLPSLEIVKALLDRGAKVDAPLKRPLPGRSGMDAGDTSLGEGTTPLMRAARSGDHQVIRLLLAQGADTKLTTRDGNTALLFAAGVGYRDKNTRGTEADALESVKVLMAAGLDLKQTNNRGENTLHGAANRGADLIAQFLLDQGLDVNATNKQGYTPVDIALGKAVVGQLPVPKDSTVALLKKAGGKEGTPRPAGPPARSL